MKNIFFRKFNKDTFLTECGVLGCRFTERCNPNGLLHHARNVTLGKKHSNTIESEQHSVRNVTLGKKNSNTIESSEKMMHRQALGLEQHPDRNVAVWQILKKTFIELEQHSVRNVTLGKKNKITIELHSVRNVTLGKKHKITMLSSEKMMHRQVLGCRFTERCNPNGLLLHGVSSNRSKA